MQPQAVHEIPSARKECWLYFPTARMVDSTLGHNLLAHKNVEGYTNTLLGFQAFQGDKGKE